MNNPEIHFVKNKDIDCQKWNQCVASSTVPLVYAQSEYLDMVSPNWSALIWGDYEYIMPLVIKQKFGITFLLQPIFAQQHGIFPQAGITIQNIFLTYIRNHFRYVAIHLNSSHSEPFPGEFKVSRRVNFILNLSQTYDDLKSN